MMGYTKMTNGGSIAREATCGTCGQFWTTGHVCSTACEKCGFEPCACLVEYTQIVQYQWPSPTDRVALALERIAKALEKIAESNEDLDDT